MKFGVLVHKTTMNLGDDIQSYAGARFLPHIDYVVDREALDSFTTPDGKPCALIMSAWYMWKKWNWPPSKDIWPLLIGYHHFERQEMVRSLPIMKEHFEGVGGQWLKDYSPVGCRDNATVRVMKNLGLDAYFSGCITLTLPRQKETSDKGTYVCVVDCADEVVKRVENDLKGTGLHVKKLTHACDYRTSTASWQERSQVAEDRLTIYQNARCVVTSRLHVCLPCLAMETPVLLLSEHRNDETGQFDKDRFDPYLDYVNDCAQQDFVSGAFKYDYMNPPANPEVYKPVRANLIRMIEEFVETYKDNEQTSDELNKATYSEEERLTWQLALMKGTAEKVILENDAMKKSDPKHFAKVCDKSITLAREVIDAVDTSGKTLSEMKETVKVCNGYLTDIKDNYNMTRRAIDQKELGFMGLVVRKIQRTIQRRETK